MNTNILMTSSSLVLGLAGIFALFAPDVLLAALGVPMADPLPMLIQLIGALYFSILLMLVVYAVFASLFYWLVFRATGIKVDKNTKQ